MRGARRSWIINVCIAIDQLGNAIAGGNPDATISGRCGYFSRVQETRLRRYWRILEWVINFTFIPIDGPDHCYRSYLWDRAEKHEEGSDFMRVLLGVIVIFFCMPLCLFTWLYVLVFPSARWKKEEP
ncbi:hypothetical protein [Microbulbifer variabilis]|jgi:hypothetical protein|uniref:Uncharacterized protein n=1 Tax=Microbulbifer variabilis TaxID=266805 RepID=A0ABY4VDA8_9GAMM|nr:hypothetical protein [Microbulbifer variabilis]USD22285.1 hypothetical protein MJO52_03910 [Microbulbifer variabilis]